ncbi:MAG: hypothetical protein KAH23_08945 [Kiritimatiellae bacterium]|nr:hypothetical protein [Kiritimatiellia bacterium]
MLRKEIIDCMAGLSPNDEGFDARFVFPDTFTGFNGHFPDNPILPGICTVQTVLVSAGVWKEIPVKLEEIVTAKFFFPISPGDELLLSCKSGERKNGDSLLKASASCNGKEVAKITLQVAYTGNGEADG